MKLENKVAIITGQSRGLGKALASAFLQEGAIIPRCTRQQLDMLNPASVFDYVRTVWGNHGAIDIVVNNAAILGPVGPLIDCQPSQTTATVITNLLSPMYLTQMSLLPLLSCEGRGKVINICGGGTTSPLPRRAAYAVAKAGLARFSDTLAEEYSMLDVNAVLPGPLPTDMLDEIIEAGETSLGEREFAEHVALKETLDDSAIQKAVDLCVYLASSASDGLSGKLISARHDNWQEWDIPQVMASPKYTLRRIDG